MCRTVGTLAKTGNTSSNRFKTVQLSGIDVVGEVKMKFKNICLPIFFIGLSLTGDQNKKLATGLFLVNN